MKPIIIFLFGLILLVTALKAQDKGLLTQQDSIAKKRQKEAKIFTSKSVAKRLFSPEASSLSSIINSTSSLNLQSDFGQQEASATIGGTINQSTFSAVFKQPFSQKPDQINPLSLDGLDNGTSVKIGFQSYLWRTKSIREISQIFDSIKIQYYLSTHGNKKRIACKDLTTLNKIAKVDYYFYDGDKKIEVDSFSAGRCCCCCKTHENLYNDSIDVYYPKNINHLNEDDRDSINSISWQRLDSVSQAAFYKLVVIKTYLFNFSAGFAKNEFNYIADSFSITPSSMSKVNQSYTASVGKIFNPENPKSISVLVLSYVLSRTYEAGSDPVEYSFPIGTNGGRFGEKVTVGIPSNNLNSRVSLEWRRKFKSTALIKDFAISPSISYLFNKESLAISLPIYFLQYKENNKVAGLQGGINIGYLTQLNQGKLANFNKGFGASIFVAAPFDLFSGF